MKISEEQLAEFKKLHLEIREIEKTQDETRLGMNQTQLSSLQKALQNAEANLTQLRQNT